MIADRFEIIDDGHLTIAIRHGANTLYIDELEDEFAVAAIRQQARDIEQLRAELAAAVAARANMDTDRLEWMNRAEQAEAERSNLQEALDSIDGTLRSADAAMGRAIERAGQAEARLAAIDGAPTVADVIAGLDGGKCVQERAFGLFVPDVGTELIARPAKD